MNSARRILFSANDPGGANAILPVVKALVERGDTVHGILTGPALEQFKTLASQFVGNKLRIEIIDGTNVSDEDLAREIAAFKPDVCLAGTSIGKSIDKRILALLKDVPSVYVIDFWSHYGHRFSKITEKDAMHLPTRICVIDERMRGEMQEEGFSPERIIVTGNPHFDHFADAITCNHEEVARV